MQFTDNARAILSNRYLQNGESPEDMFWRVANAISLAEKTKELQDLWKIRFFNLMDGGKFLPNSPTLANAGKNSGCLSACFTQVLDDSMHSIMQTAYNAAMIEKWGGGVGFGFSRLRPKNDKIATVQGKACGPVKAMKLFQKVGETLTQGSFREGAHMGQLFASHPDLIEFIHSKDNDDTLQNFNISVLVTDEFMKCVEEDQDWNLINPRNNEVVETVKARRVWKELCESAWKTGDPGIGFIDRVWETQPNPRLGRIESSNPCWPGNTKVWTIDGPKRFDELVGKEIPVLTVDNAGKMVFKKMCNIRKTGQNSKTLKIVIESRTRKKYVRSTLALTPNHNLILKNGQKIKAQDLKLGDRLASVYRHFANSKKYLALENGVDCDMEHKIIAAYTFGSKPEYPKYHVDHIDENKQNNLPENLRVLLAHDHNSIKMLGDKNPMRNGWWSILDENEKEKYRKLKSILSSGERNGMFGKKHSDAARKNISTGVLNAVKSGKKLGRSAKSVNHVVISIESGSNCDVYNGTVEDIHKYYVEVAENEGILSANCSEEFLENNGSCNLGSINLYKFVKDKQFDYEGFRDTIYDAVRFLDDVVEVNSFPLPALKEMNEKTRRIGLGVMGWADLLVAMEIQYDSEKALKFASVIGKYLLDKAWGASAALAEEKGEFPEYKNSALAKHFPLVRNSSVLTIAPTGTISRLANCSSGIEPYFSLAWQSNILWHEGESQKFLDCPTPIYDFFVKQIGHESVKMFLEKLAENPSKAKQILKAHGIDSSLFRTANEISPEWHVKMQATWQKYVTNGVSKTINMVNNATVKDVENAYMLAWKTGCKAISIYRDGSKSMQVLETGDTRRKMGRPKKLTGTTHKINTGHGTAYITVNEKDGKPFEVFTTLGKAGGCDSAQLEAVSRLISLCLRSGIAAEEIVAQLKGIVCCPVFYEGDKILSTPDAIAYVLSGKDDVDKPPIILDEKKVYNKNGRGCPDCGQSLVEQEGCKTCISCGWSKC